MVRYAQYSFNLQHNIDHTVIEQCMNLNAYEEQTICTSLEMERLGHENHILCHGTFAVREKD
jgi:hypothetical protein